MAQQALTTAMNKAGFLGQNDLKQMILLFFCVLFPNSEKRTQVLSIISPNFATWEVRNIIFYENILCPNKLKV